MSKSSWHDSWLAAVLDSTEHSKGEREEKTEYKKVHLPTRASKSSFLLVGLITLWGVSSCYIGSACGSMWSVLLWFQRRATLRTSEPMYWVAAKELNKSLGFKETLSSSRYPHYGNLSPKPYMSHSFNKFLVSPLITPVVLPYITPLRNLDHRSYRIVQDFFHLQTLSPKP